MQTFIVSLQGDTPRTCFDHLVGKGLIKEGQRLTVETERVFDEDCARLHAATILTRDDPEAPTLTVRCVESKDGFFTFYWRN